MKKDIDRILGAHLNNLDKALKEMPNRAEAIKTEIILTNDVLSATKHKLQKNFPEIAPVKIDQKSRSAN